VQSTDRLIETIAALIAPDTPVEHGNGQAAISRDTEILGEMLSGSDANFRLRLWTNEKCLVATRAQSRRAGFAKACEAARAAGWPVHVRSSGGTTVVHRPGILNVSLFRSGSAQPPGTDSLYHELVDTLCSALWKIGVSATAGSVNGSFCNGRYNICVDGRKVAGTAGQSRIGRARHAHLAHASLIVDGDIAEDLDIISRFESELGLNTIYKPEAHISIGALISLRSYA